VKARLTINGVVQAMGGTFTNGEFSYYVWTTNIKAGDTVTVTAYDVNNKELDKYKKVVVKSSKDSMIKMK